MIIRSQPQSKTYNLSIKFKAHFFLHGKFLKNNDINIFQGTLLYKKP